MDFRLRQPGADPLKHLEKPIAQQCRLPSRYPKYGKMRWSRIDQRLIFPEIKINVISLQRRLTAHDASIVALRSNKQCIVVGIYVDCVSHYPRVPVIQLLNIGRTSSVRSVSSWKRYSIIILCL